MLTLYYSDTPIDNPDEIPTKGISFEVSPIALTRNKKYNGFFHEQKNGRVLKNIINVISTYTVTISEDQLSLWTSKTIRLSEWVETFIASQFTYGQSSSIERGYPFIFEMLSAPKWTHPHNNDRYNEVSIEFQAIPVYDFQNYRG